MGVLDTTEVLISRIDDGDERALSELFVHHRERLRRMIQLRIDPRISARVDASDVLQEAYLDVSKRARQYVQHPSLPAFLWLRYLTGQRLRAIHRKHFGAWRDANQEVSLWHGDMPHATSASLAAMLLGRLTTPSHAALRAEQRARLQDALNAMDPIDREVLVLRHFEELSNGETAEVLGLSRTAASNRYVRALQRLHAILSGIPGLR